MPAPPDSVHVRQLLARREAELHQLLRASTCDAVPVEADDFKDLALAESQAAVDEAQAAHAVAELAQLHAARRRLEDGRWGVCEECGEVIDPRRLQALPAARHCASCQAMTEQRARAH